MFRIAALKGEPIKAWECDGLPCAIYSSSLGINGYVRLPEIHPDLAVAQEAELQPGRPFTFPDGTAAMHYNHGYDFVDVEAPGGWTYGPDFEGWIGFDTAHAGDHWSLQERLKYASDEHERWAIAYMAGLFVIEDLLPDPYRRDWTMELLVAAVERCAKQLAVRARVAMERS